MTPIRFIAVLGIIIGFGTMGMPILSLGADVKPEAKAALQAAQADFEAKEKAYTEAKAKLQAAQAEAQVKDMATPDNLKPSEDIGKKIAEGVPAAQEEPRQMISFSGAFSLQQVRERTQPNQNANWTSSYDFGLNVDYQYLVTENIGLGAQASGHYGWGDSDAASKNGQMNALATFHYHFVNKSLFVPYVGARGGWTYMACYSPDLSVPLDRRWVYENGYSLGAMFGFNYYLDQNRRISFMAEYAPLYTHVMDPGWRFLVKDTWQHQINFGIGYRF
ncbi:MAG: hypothetical protein NTY01_24100 [Verrucomicrobia bacterium]|nr:hypothetical protein [Verrucomicrobiota bacterium]